MRCFPYKVIIIYVSKLLNKHYPDIRLQAVFRSPSRLSGFFNFEGRFPSLLCPKIAVMLLIMENIERDLKIRCIQHFGINKSCRKIKDAKQFVCLGTYKWYLS